MSSTEHHVIIAGIPEKVHSNEEQSLWLDTFIHFFKVLYKQVSEVPCRVSALSSSSSDAEALVDDAQVFIAVLSPAYFKDSRLLGITQRFITRAQSEKRLLIGGRTSFIKVVYHPFSWKEGMSQLEAVSHLPVHEFYDIDVLTSSPRVYDPRVRSETQHAYWLKLSDICNDVSYMVSHDKPLSSGSAERHMTVYLASVGADMVFYRDMLRRELMGRGYYVLPDTYISADLPDLSRRIEKDLSSSALSVHLIGEDFGSLIKGSDYSLVSLQNMLAHRHTLRVMEHVKSAGGLGFQRLLWVDPNVEVLSERQRLFIENVKTEAAMIEEAEVMEVRIEEFKHIIRDTLRKLLPKVHSEAKSDDGLGDKRSVYLMCDPRDKDLSSRLAGILIDEGFRVLALSQEGSPSELRQEHQEHLRICDGSVILYNRGSDQWFGSKLQDLFKAPAFGRERPLRAKAIVAHRSFGFDILDIKKHIRILDGATGGSGFLEPFIRQLKSG